jgi:ABC-2 type transport system permease protein
MISTIKIFFRLQLVQLRAAVEYRADFWIAVVGAVLQQLVGITFLVTLFGHVDSLGGWSVWQIAVLHGLIMSADGLRELFADGVWALRMQVNNGAFDRVLVRPVSPALQQITALASIHGIGNVGTGVVLLVVGLARSGPDWHWWTLPVLVLAVLAGCVLNTAISFLANMIAFWEPGAQSAFPTLIGLMRDFAKFPLDIYGAALRILVTFLLPYAVISYFPSRLVLDIGDPAGWWAITPVIAATAAAVLAALVWRKGINRYQGVGH